MLPIAAYGPDGRDLYAEVTPTSAYGDPELAGPLASAMAAGVKVLVGPVGDQRVTAVSGSDPESIYAAVASECGCQLVLPFQTDLPDPAYVPEVVPNQTVF